MSRVLVTGGAGFIGSHLVERLLDEGHEVWAIDCFDGYYPAAIKRRNLEGVLSHERFRLFEGDLCDQEWLSEKIGGQEFSIIYHLAARAGISGSCKDPLGYTRMNYEATLSLLEVLRHGPRTRFVFASSSSVYGNTSAIPFSEDDPAVHPISPYASLKRSIELLLFTYHHLYQMPVMCLRFFTVYGPRQRPEMAISWFTRAIMRGDEIEIFGDGSSERDYSFIDDIVAGAMGAMNVEFDYEIINLGGSERTRLSDLIQVIEQVTGKQARVEQRPTRSEELVATCADITRARQRLGYDPKTRIEEGVERYFAWYRDHETFIDQVLPSPTIRA